MRDVWRSARRPASLAVLSFILAGPLSNGAYAADKEVQRLQFQVSGLQGQLVGLQRAVEDNVREIKRLSELLAEQNATTRKGVQDARLQDEAILNTLKEISERLAEMSERMQAAARVQAAPPAEPAAPVQAPGTTPGQTALAPRELYSQAYADYARGNYDVAMQAFQEYLRAYPDTEFSDNAQYWIGECLYGKQKWNDAIEAWKTLIRDFPSSDKLPDARVKMGMALEKLGRRSQALLEYRFVVDRYPNSPAARIAREKLSP
jgi:tol-pal system protein YbgF